MMFKFRQTKFLLLVKNIDHKADGIATFNPTISYFKKCFMPFNFFFQWCPRDWRSLLWWWNQSKFGIRSKYDAYYLLQKRRLCPQQRFQFSGKTMSYRQRYWNYSVDWFLTTSLLRITSRHFVLKIKANFFWSAHFKIWVTVRKEISIQG